MTNNLTSIILVFYLLMFSCQIDASTKKNDLVKVFNEKVEIYNKNSTEENRNNIVKAFLDIAQSSGKAHQFHLPDFNLEEVNLEGVHLSEANFKGTNFKAANLKKTNLESVNLKDAWLMEANLEKANLEWADLKNANLQGANLKKANLYGVNLGDADLRDVNLEGANLEGTNLEGAKYSEKTKGLDELDKMDMVLIETNQSPNAKSGIQPKILTRTPIPLETLVFEEGTEIIHIPQIHFFENSHHYPKNVLQATLSQFQILHTLLDMIERKEEFVVFEESVWKEDLDRLEERVRNIKNPENIKRHILNNHAKRIFSQYSRCL